MNLDDVSLLDKVIELGKQCSADYASEYYVLEENIIKELNNFKTSLGKGDDFYSLGEAIKKLWIKLVDKSIKCLKYYDPREPFMENKNKKPETYRIEDLKSYFDQFSSFEGLLYGSNNEYRDHAIHVFRTWLLGVFILLTKSSKTNTRIIDKIVLDGFINSAKNDTIDLFTPNKFELLSMWTMISLCHDLGYPLEKREGVINKTEKMMANFFPNANITMTYNNISGVHDESIRNIVKFISSVIESSVIGNNSDKKTKYSSRIQSKYYNKINKSLENYSHGIISAIILFKSLEYFSESDFCIEGDYSDSQDDVKQFYIRREILRSIAMHTCFNAYHIKTTTLPFLLILCDELQEWNRKTFIEFYSGKHNIDCSVDLDLDELNENKVRICENLKFKTIPDYEKIITKYFKQYEKYKKIFRDGLDTNLREFSFNKEVKIIKNKKEIVFLMDISKDENSKFKIKYETAKREYNKLIKTKIENKYKLDENENYCLVSQKEF